jgi:hypothetical protein
MQGISAVVKTTGYGPPGAKTSTWRRHRPVAQSSPPHLSQALALVKPVVVVKARHRLGEWVSDSDVGHVPGSTQAAPLAGDLYMLQRAHLTRLQKWGCRVGWSDK